MKIYKNAADAAAILRRGRFDDEEKRAAVRAIVQDVRTRGDAALFEYCEKFDDTSLTAATVAVSREEIGEAYAQVNADLLSSMKKAAKNVLDYHSRSPMREDIRTDGRGRTTGYTVRAVERAGIYVPGGHRAAVQLGADGRAARKGGWGGAYLCLHARQRRQDRARGARRRRSVRRRKDLQGRRRAGDRRARLRHGEHPEGRRHRRPRQHLRHPRQKRGVRRGRHRHARRPLRDPHHSGREAERRPHRGGYPLAGRARQARPRPSCSPTAPPSRSGSPRKRSGSSPSFPAAKSPHIRWKIRAASSS